MVEQAYYQTPGHLIAAAVILPVLNILTVASRFYARRTQRLGYHVDDWLTVPALFLMLGLAAALITGVAKNALGYPTPATTTKRNLLPRVPLTVTNPEITITSQIEWAFYLISIPALGFVKLSFLFLYRRIFCVHSKSAASIVTGLMIIIMIAWTIAYFFAFLFACGTNFSAWWGSTVSLMTRCVKTFELLYSLAMSDCITDAVIILIPIPLVWQLHMTTGQKVAVSAVFLLGSVALAASITRLVFVAKAYYIGFTPTADEDLTLTTTLYWGMIECGLGLFAACLPTLRVFIQEISSKTLTITVKDLLSIHSTHSHRNRDGGPNNLISKTCSKTYSAPDDYSVGSDTHIAGVRTKEDVTPWESYAMEACRTGMV